MQGLCAFIVCCQCCMCANAAPHSSSAFGVLLSDDIPLIKSSCSLFGCWNRARVSIADLSDVVLFWILFILKSSHCHTYDCVVVCPGFHFKGSVLSSRQCGREQSTHWRKTEREAVSVFFFFSNDSLSTYSLLLIYSNCGETACAYCKSKGFSERN